MASTQVRRCTVYGGRGEPHILAMELVTPHEPVQVHTGAGDIPLMTIASRDLVCARPDLDIAEVVRLMIRHHVGCIPVVDERRHPVGVITKFDIVEQIDAMLRSVANGSPLPADLSARNADEIMLPLAFTLDEQASIAHAAAMMTSEDVHHVLVVGANGQLIGIVSSKDIASWLVANDHLETEHAVATWRPGDTDEAC
jgi:CBS domain-containing protein